MSITRGQWTGEDDYLSRSRSDGNDMGMPMSPDDWRDLHWICERALGMEEHFIIDINKLDPPVSIQPEVGLTDGRVNDLARRVEALEKLDIDHAFVERGLAARIDRLAATVEKIVAVLLAWNGMLVGDRPWLELGNLKAHVDSKGDADA